MCATPKKTEIKKTELPDGSIVCWPREYSHLEEPKTPSAKATENKQRVVAALRDCQLALPYSEYEDGLPNLTGRYQGPESLCCINQAGLYLVVWWKFLRADLDKWTYGANYDPETGLFVLHEPDDPSQTVADLVVVRRGSVPEIRFDWYPSGPGPADVLVRYSPRATLSARALDALRAVLPAKPHPVVKGFIESEHTPLAPSEVDEVRLSLTSVEVKRDLQVLFRHEVTHTAESWADIRTAILPITRSLYTMFRDDLKEKDLDPKNGLIPNPNRDRVMQPRVRFAVQEIIHEHSLTLEVGKDAVKQTATLYEWFQRGLYYNDKGTGGSPNIRFKDAVRNWLGVNATGGYLYDLEVDLDGIVLEGSLPGGKWIGKKIKKHTDKLPEGAAKRITKWLEDKVQANAGARGLTGPLTIKSRGLAENWEATYWVFLAIAGGGGGGGDIGLRYLRGTGTAETDLEWSPEHFSGGFTILTGEGARDKHGKLEKNQLIWIAEGSHPSEPSIQLVLNRIDTDLSASSIGVGWGDIWNPKDIKRTPPTPIKPKVYSYTAKYGRSDDTHFALGSATVRDEARRILRILAANELVALRDASCRVTFDGFADRLGGVGYNDVLSEMRAENTKTALLDCLDATVAARMTVHGHGERPLAFLDKVFDFPDNSPSPEWRRVFVLLHGVASVELLVRDLKDLG